MMSGSPGSAKFRFSWSWIAGGGVLIAGCALVVALFAAGQPLVAVALSVLIGAGLWIFTSRRAYAYRYLFPGMVTVALFVVFPIVFTFGVGFTNYSAKNLLSYDRARQYLLDETVALEGAVNYTFTLLPAEGGFRLRLEDDDHHLFLSAPLPLDRPSPEAISVTAATPGDPALSQAPAEMATVIARRDALKALKVKLPSGQVSTMSGLRQFTSVMPRYAAQPDGSLRDAVDGAVLTPDFTTGFFVNGRSGAQVIPGFKTYSGLANFRRIFTDPKFREPFIRIFVWTIVFAGATVLSTFALGVILATLLSWESLPLRGLFRMLLFLPYAVPAFISILVFRGLFNESFGEINLILHGLFGIKPSWGSDPLLARVMLLIVNTWLGYPYMMVLCMGLIKSIPADLYEVSALAGAGPITNFTRITLPLIIRPIAPLLIASFAFNFNNFVLINLLTGGGPDFLDTQVPAGATDVLVTYTYRIAFTDSSQHFGLAAAISTVIFFLVALMSIVQLRLTKSAENTAR